jgi:hypothetical protein
MRLKIIASTDNRFLGIEVEDEFPLNLNDYLFMPAYAPIKLSDTEWRFYNSNYSIDTQVIPNG